MSGKLKYFVNTQLHGQKWPKQTWIVFRNPWTDKFVIIQNNHESHAEIELIKWLKCQPQLQTQGSSTPKPPVNLKLFINNSPCSDCSKALVEFLKEQSKKGVKIQMEIIFSGLYNIKRPSCETRRCEHKSYENYHSDRPNVEGIKELIRFGVKIRPFRKDDWEQLADLLSEKYPSEENRDKEDGHMWDDFKILFGCEGGVDEMAYEQAPETQENTSVAEGVIGAMAGLNI